MIGNLLLAGLAMLCVLSGLPAGAQAAEKHAAMVMDANTGRVLYARQADEPRFPASLTKMMTLYIVFELMQQGRLDAKTPIRISATAAGTAPSKLDLEEGAQITLMDAIKALITKSANDVAVAVAERIAGSEEKFASLMTRKARSIGMNATVFRNAHGLPHPEQTTTARDMITLALHLNDDFPRYYGLFATRTFDYAGETYRNHNTLLGRVEGIDGIKTGYTSASGFNLVASIRRDGKHVVGVVFGGTTASARNATMRTLLARALAQASTQKTRRPALVARAAPAPERAHRRAARPIETARAPVADDRLAAAQQPAQAASAGSEATGEQQPTRAPRIDIARVRPVMVAPRSRTAEFAMPAPVTLAAMRTSPETDSHAQSQPVADLASNRRGAGPSSLQAQAERISRGETAIEQPEWDTAQIRPRSDVSHHAPAALAGSGTSAAHAFAVQVGAFASEAEARRQLQSALDRSGGWLAGRLPTTQPVQYAGRQLYRARFSGFDSHAATSACQELKRRQISCLVAKVE